MDSFPDRLTQLIQSRSVRKKDLAAHLGITYRNLRNYETGERKPDFEGLITLADFFGVSLDYLTGRSDDPERR